MVCKGICVRHKALKPVGNGRYSSGQKRCQVCELFLRWDGFWCPCCGYRLRTGPRNTKCKNELRTRKEIEKGKLSAVNEQSPIQALQKNVAYKNRLPTFNIVQEYWKISYILDIIVQYKADIHILELVYHPKEWCSHLVQWCPSYHRLLYTSMQDVVCWSDSRSQIFISNFRYSIVNCDSRNIVYRWFTKLM